MWLRAMYIVAELVVPLALIEYMCAVNPALMNVVIALLAESRHIQPPPPYSIMRLLCMNVRFVKHLVCLCDAFRSESIKLQHST